MSRRLPSLRLPEGTELIPFIVLSIVIFAAINPAFVKPANLLTILSSLAFVGVIAVGQTVVIIGGQIDLSVGANAALSAVVSAKLMVAGVPIVLSLLAGVGVGIVVGLANGLLSMTGIPSFIVTIGTLYIVGGVAVFVTHGQPIFPLPPAITAFGTAKVGPFTASFLAMIALFLVVDSFLRFARAGRSVYAVGGDAAVARLAGISSHAVTLATFAFCGLTAALAGLLQMAALESASNTIGSGWELASIAAVVIGGTSIFGGKGTVFGTLLGLLLLGVVTNGLVSARVQPNWQTLAVGAIMISAIGLDFLRRQVRTRSVLRRRTSVVSVPTVPQV